MFKISESIHIKQPKTHREQLEMLKKRNLTITNEIDALSFLERVNYYRLSAYGLTLKKQDGTGEFKNDITFEHMQMIYNFDKKLREILIYYLESIEIEFRTKIAYYHSHDFGPLGYENPRYFKKTKFHEEFLAKLQDGINRSGKELFIIHHKTKYNGVFPFWVAIEVMSFGELSKLFRNLLRTSQMKVIKDFKASPDLVSSWLHTLSYIRNVCAHYGRLYGKDLIIKPQLNIKLTKGYFDNSRVFSTIFVLNKLLHQKDQANFIVSLETLIKEYSDYINLEEIGFPEKWVNILKTF